MMEVLTDTYNMYKETAKLLGDYSSLSKTDIANKYCDADEAGDELTKGKYFAALVLEYWYMIPLMKKKTGNSSNITIEEVETWVEDGLLLGLKYRKWREKGHKLYKNPKGAEIVFNRSIETMKQRWFQVNNRATHKTQNYINSLDAYLSNPMNEDNQDCQMCLEDKSATIDINMRLFIEKLVKNNKLFEAIVIDNICYRDGITNKTKISIATFNEEKFKTHNYISSYNQAKLVDSILSADRKYIKSFVDTYGSDYRTTVETFKRFATLKRTKLNKKIARTLASFKHKRGFVDAFRLN